ncbi:cation acetate symporter [Saccharopolyspora erythraea]|uniref:sodium/solute symporter n=1 Tax=Saccharopolyspora erythraea TaxID=1836 RepID=UPI001BA9B04B|nr:cation acetate symporter [Saccharopolyspora erythraea]QUG99497.1 cation acetate symporter [Saccharopolyspora erythraea]
MSSSIWALCGIGVIAAATFGIGFWGARNARATSDFLAARQSVREERNAAAISGEYLSAASFLGIAGLVLKEGVDALWYPIGFAAGYLALMLFVAAPLRRSGAYTLPDFAEERLDSLPLRWLSTALVVLIGWLYLVPQMQAAGLTLSSVTGHPYWVGVLAVTGLVLVSVLSGGMRAVTLVQAFQYWVKLFAITLPAFVLFFVFMTGDAQHQRALDSPAPPVFERDTAVHFETDVRLRVDEPVWVQVVGAEPGTVYMRPGEHPVSTGVVLRFPAGSPVPVVDDAESDNASWLRPQDGGIRGLVETYSVILATFLGTMGLPHVLARFYSNPNGQGARRTTLYVLALLGAFYLFPTVFGLLSRFYVPMLLVTGETDAAVLLLPHLMLGNWLGGLLGAVTAAGAFAAFLSTSSGLLVSVAGVLSADVLRGRAVDVRLMMVVSCVLPTLLALRMSDQDITQSVGLAFAMAASTFCPMLVLGIWWRGLTAAGAAAGLVTGGGLVLAAVVVSMLTGDDGSWAAALSWQPAVVTVPAAFLVTWGVSRATRRRVPAGVSRVMLRMHAPDRLGFIDDRTSVRGVPQEPRTGRHLRE